MKHKPVFKNITKGRIQIIQRGIPVWLNPGDVIVGEPYRAFLSLGLKEVGRDGLPQLTKTRKELRAAINDDKPEASPIKVREMRVVDAVMPVDDIKMGPSVDVLPMKAAKPDPEPAPEPEAEEEPEAELPALPPVDSAAGPSGEALKAMLIAELEDEEPVLAISLEDKDPDDELIVIEEEPEPEVETHPYVCEECGRGFASKRGLKSHLRSHK